MTFTRMTLINVNKLIMSLNASIGEVLMQVFKSSGVEVDSPSERLIEEVKE